jgi:hypothetical protein
MSDDGQRGVVALPEIACVAHTGRQRPEALLEMLGWQKESAGQRSAVVPPSRDKEQESVGVAEPVWKQRPSSPTSAMRGRQ